MNVCNMLTDDVTFLGKFFLHCLCKYLNSVISETFSARLCNICLLTSCHSVAARAWRRLTGDTRGTDQVFLL